MLGSTEEGAHRAGGLRYRPGEGEEEAEGQGGEAGARTSRGTELEECERVRGRGLAPRGRAHPGNRRKVAEGGTQSTLEGPPAPGQELLRILQVEPGSPVLGLQGGSEGKSRAPRVQAVGQGDGATREEVTEQVDGIFGTAGKNGNRPFSAILKSSPENIPR